MANNAHVIDDDTVVEILEVRAGGPAEFVEQVVSDCFSEVHASGETTIDVLHEETTVTDTLYVVRIETEE